MFPGSPVRLQLYEEGGGDSAKKLCWNGIAPGGMPPCASYPPCMRATRLRRGKSRPHIPPYK